MKNKEDFLYDVRIINRNIRDGVVSKKDYDKYLDNLPDVEANSEPLIIEDETETLSTVPDAADTEEAAGEAEEEED
ncbi:MAG TPA: hypothetical protein PKC29_11035 [Thermodesulfobacteriota bacterium]|nr:hypothetical protein [Thermodesulfobacteriota bacterium]